MLCAVFPLQKWFAEYKVSNQNWETEMLIAGILLSCLVYFSLVATVYLKLNDAPTWVDKILQVGLA